MFGKRLVPFLFAAILVACRPAAAGPTPAPTETLPPSPSATSTPGSTPVPSTPTETLAPAPQTFTEPFDGSLPYWTFLQIDNGQAADTPGTQSGFLVFNLTGPNQWVYALYALPNYADIRVDAQADFTVPGVGALGVVCRYSEGGGWYEFNIYPDQSYELLYGIWLSPGLARYTPLFRGASDKISADANEIGLVCQGNTLTPFINGVQMRRWQDNKIGLKVGKIGISAASFESAPFKVAFDWLKVSEP